MLDIDPQIIKIGKIFAGAIAGMFIFQIVLQYLQLDNLLEMLAGSAIGALAGAGVMVIHIFKNNGKDDDEE